MPVHTISFDRSEDVRPPELIAVKSVRELADSLGIRYSTLVFFANTGRSLAVSVAEPDPELFRVHTLLIGDAAANPYGLE